MRMAHLGVNYQNMSFCITGSLFCGLTLTEILFIASTASKALGSFLTATNPAFQYCYPQTQLLPAEREPGQGQDPEGGPLGGAPGTCCLVPWAPEPRPPHPECAVVHSH